jgi:hypothetical protein
MNATLPTVLAPVPEALQHLHGLIALRLRERHGFVGKDALSVATACIEALQQAHGGDRLGSRGVYIPSLPDRQHRRERIKELMGPAPHSRKRARQVAQQVGCGETTVWRALYGEQWAERKKARALSLIPLK